VEQKTTYQIIAILSLICLIFSVVIYLENTQYSLHHNNICSAITGTNGCEIVQTSNFGKTFGISNAWFGIVGFTLLGTLSLTLIKGYKNKKYIKINKGYNKIINYLMITGGIIAGIVAILFIYLQAFVIHAYCLFCMIVDISSIIIVGLVAYLLFGLKNKVNRHK